MPGARYGLSHMTARGFQAVCSRHLGDWNADGTLYRHVRTGMEVFHVDSKDGEYFFAYSFRTLPQDSSGVFHILEHTVLSGSRRYPVKDPFSILDAHSCNSYMNALTCPDRTLYPAASPVRKDFDNIFALYTDSVFRPLLRRQDFESEGIRVGREGFEGVVFNEMRGETSRKDSIVSSHSKRDLFEGSPYFFSSGGDVMAMTGLSYEEYRRTYERFYCPANCRLFIYGHDLDIGRILDDLDRDYLSGMDGGAPVADPVDPPHWDAPRSKEMTCQATGGDDKGEFVLSFLTSGRAWDGYDNIFVSVLVDALLGGPSNPLYSALLECGLGDDLSDNSGMSADFDRIPFSVGMDGVDAADAPRLESFIMDSLERIAREGIGEEVIEAAIRRQEFLLQEVSGGIPNGLRMFFKCIRGWERGLDLGDVLDARSKLARLRCDLEANPRLFEDWMLSQLVDNPHRLGLYVRPVADQAESQEGLLHDIWLSRRDRWHGADDEDEARSIDIPTLTLDDIREDLKILQRRTYNENDDNSKVEVRIGRLDELVRSTAGRLDELDHKIGRLEEKIDLINRDMDVRMKLLEGKKIESSGAAVVDNSPKFSAPVAKDAPTSIVGGAISGGDLQPLKKPTAADIYQQGLQALKDADFDQAEESFNTILSKFPQDKLAGNAQYWLGETYYARKDFERAAVAFGKGYQGYENSPKKADSLLKLGMSMQELGQKENACAAFTGLPEEFPKAEKQLLAKAAERAEQLGCK